MSASLLKRASWVQPRESVGSLIGGGGGGGNRGSMMARGSVLGTALRRDMMAMQAELDRQVFDSSLGSPLSSFDGATLDLVGGKALQCWRLTKHGFPVPTSCKKSLFLYNCFLLLQQLNCYKLRKKIATTILTH